jgi:hypothetical protein
LLLTGKIGDYVASTIFKVILDSVRIVRCCHIRVFRR